MNIQNFTLREMNELETLIGRSLKSVGDDDALIAGLTTAMAYIVKKRDNPEFTYEQALDLTFAEATALMGEEEDEQVGE
jgi:hypothetical protein